MNTKIASQDSGSYVDGVYTTKNGFSGSGLGCPKGTRVWDVKEGTIQPFHFVPKDFTLGETEQFLPITREVAPDIMPYYTISNYGRVMNIKSGKIMKPNYRPNGYEYLCLSADNCKYGQKKYSTHRLVMMTFDHIDDPENFEVNHINGVKSDNYINKTMEDGTIQSNLEWVTCKENQEHKWNSLKYEHNVFTDAEVNKIRELRNKEALTLNEIKEKYFPNKSITAIQYVCANKSYHDPNYQPLTMEEIADKRVKLYDGIYTDDYRPNSGPVLSDRDANVIRAMKAKGFTQKEICDMYNISRSTVTDIVTGKTHNK